MALGSSKPWATVIAKLLPDNPQLSADAILDYYKPMLDWLKSKNKEHKSHVGWNATKKSEFLRNLLPTNLNFNYLYAILQRSCKLIEVSTRNANNF